MSTRRKTRPPLGQRNSARRQPLETDSQRLLEQLQQTDDPKLQRLYLDAFDARWPDARAKAVYRNALAQGGADA